MVRGGREEEGVSSLRAEIAAIARTLQTVPVESDLLYLCDSEAALNKILWWIGSGPRTTLAGDANADIMATIIECLRKKRVQNGGRNGVFSDGPMGAAAPDGFGRKNSVRSRGARTTSSRFRPSAKWGELLGGE
jgi:hypothetical protein